MFKNLDSVSIQGMTLIVSNIISTHLPPNSYIKRIWHLPPVTHNSVIPTPGKYNKWQNQSNLNYLCLTDVYNLSHQGMKINTDWEVSHIYNRTAGQILFGFADTMREFLSSILITEDMIREATEIAQRFGMTFPEDLFRRLIEQCDGRIPLQVETLPDGTFCPPGTPFAQISNTIHGFGELVTYFEGIFLHNHFSTACATEAFHMRKYLEETRQKYGYDESFLNRFSSFGFRGHRSLDDAIQAGRAWSLFLRSTDDFHIGQHCPDADLGSIPALAHKVVQQFDEEDDSFRKAIDYAHETGAKAVALVIDTYDTYNVINHKIPLLSEYAAKRDLDVILRPDSADTWKQVVDIYDVVKDNNLKNISAIIGEGMSLAEAKKADHFFLQNNVPLNFISYGLGSGYYKHLDRDTHGWSMKTCWSNRAPRMKFSENPFKRSIPGPVRLFMKNDELWVGHQNEVADERNLYQIAYHHDHLKENMSNLSWQDVQTRAFQTHSSQIFMKSTVGIKSMIKEFRIKYRSS